MIKIKVVGAALGAVLMAGTAIAQPAPGGPDEGRKGGHHQKHDAEPLAQDVVDAILPESVRSSEVYSRFSEVNGIFASAEGFKVMGETEEGDKVSAGFDEDGQLEHFFTIDPKAHAFMRHKFDDHYRKDMRDPPRRERDDGPKEHSPAEIEN